MKLLLVLSVAVLASSEATAIEFTHHAVLDPTSNVQLFWTVGQLDSDNITFELHARTQGWVGVGFSPNGAMANSDLVILWIDRQGIGHISDRNGPKNGPNGYPPKDAKQDYTLLDIKRNDTHLKARFTRKRHTCDEDDWEITEDTTRVIWALGDTVPQNGEQIQVHSSRGVRSLHLVYPKDHQKRRAELGPTVQNYDIRMRNVSVPHDEHTLYWCQIIEMPVYTDEKHQMIGFEMMVQPGMEKYVHHVVLYDCEGHNMSRHVGKPAPCFNPDQTEFSPMKRCGNLFTGWAVGGEPIFFPKDIGMPIFTESLRYVLVEMHYDNTDFDKGLVDNSFMRLYTTTETRPIDMGKLNVGLQPFPTKQIIPPGQKKFTSTAVCPSVCTEGLDQDIHIFSAFLHSHVLGTAIRVRHVRDGIELPPIIVDNGYDFNYQAAVLLKNPVKVTPGDELLVECDYDTSRRTEAAYGGFSTKEEMCIAFLDYYPKRPNQTATWCGSSPKDDLALKFLAGAKEVYGDKSSKLIRVVDSKDRDISFYDFMEKQVNWGLNDSKNRSQLAKDFEVWSKTGNLSIQCGSLGGHDLEAPFPKIDKLYQKRNFCAINEEPKYSSSSRNLLEKLILVLCFSFVVYFV